MIKKIKWLLMYVALGTLHGANQDGKATYDMVQSSIESPSLFEMAVERLTKYLEASSKDGTLDCQQENAIHDRCHEIYYGEATKILQKVVNRLRGVTHLARFYLVGRTTGFALPHRIFCSFFPPPTKASGEDRIDKNDILEVQAVYASPPAGMYEDRTIVNTSYDQDDVLYQDFLVMLERVALSYLYEDANKADLDKSVSISVMVSRIQELEAQLSVELETTREKLSGVKAGKLKETCRELTSAEKRIQELGGNKDEAQPTSIMPLVMAFIAGVILGQVIIPGEQTQPARPKRKPATTNREPVEEDVQPAQEELA